MSNTRFIEFANINTGELINRVTSRIGIKYRRRIDSIETMEQRYVEAILIYSLSVARFQ